MKKKMSIILLICVLFLGCSTKEKVKEQSSNNPTNITFIKNEINKMEKDIFVVDYNKIYELYETGTTIENVEELCDEELQKEQPNFTKVVTYFLFGANMNRKLSNGRDIKTLLSKNGGNVVFSASLLGYTDVVKKAIELGYSKEVAHNSKMTPLMGAVYFDRIETVKELIKLGENVNAMDAEGWTPLMFAVSQKHEKLVDILLEAGANKSFLNSNGVTALDLAKNSQNDYIISSLNKVY